MFVYLRITAEKLDWLLVGKGKQDYLLSESEFTELINSLTPAEVFHLKCVNNLEQ